VGLTVLIAVACAAPFLSMQLFLNHGVTGRWLQTPVQKYEELYWPGVVFGMHRHALPGDYSQVSWLPQFKDNYKQFVLPYFTGSARRMPRPIIQTLQWTLPQSLLIALLPIALLGLRQGRRWVIGVTLGIFPLAYIPWVMFLPYYATVVAPIMAFAVVLGARQIVESFPNQKQFLSAWLATSIAFVAILSLPEIHGKDSSTTSEAMTAFNKIEPTLSKPAVVFFTYPTGDPMAWRHEQTYNIAAASIDDEPVVRAQDLGERNIELIRYYAAKQPKRTFYSFDQKTLKLKELPVESR
jgi:hypothetical protein